MINQLLRNSVIKISAAVSGAMALSLPLPASAQPSEHTVRVEPTQASIVFFQDGHDIAPVKQGTKTDPEYHGGIARLATVLAQQKARGVPTDVAFGGDLGGGTLFGAVFHGTAMVEAFNQLGVDIAGFGQHDFDYGLATTRANIAASTFPWVSSNLSVGGKPLNGAQNIAVVRKVGGVKIGYLGLTLGMETTTAGKDIAQADYVEAAKAALPALKDADVIVALAQFPRAEDAMRLLREVPQINVVLREENSFAQEGNDITMLPDGRFAVAPEGNYGSLARINFAQTEQGRWVATHEEIQVNGSVGEEPAALALEKKYQTELEKKLATKVACSDTALEKPRALGAVAAEAFRQVAGAQIGWLNAGGMRADLAAGPLTLKDILAVFPYDNKVMKIQVTGAQLRQALEQGADSSPNGDGGGYPILAGARFSYDSGAAPGTKISDLTFADGTPIKDTQVLTLGLTNYVVGGGNNVTAFASAQVILDAGFIGSDFDALVVRLTKTSQCAAGQPEKHEQFAETGQSEKKKQKTNSTTQATGKLTPSASDSDSTSALAQGTNTQKKGSTETTGLAFTGTNIVWTGAVGVVVLVVGVLLARRRRQ
ncbi:bifunctional metallophosphatase/5'-nucleotidase [Arcanobacterium canis]|uniref:5'-nucleotidase C-terminal domain-containing protein n=1 Tax=Arcanobacterium canis TaxID=999183 RepID=A0ABY8FYC0_9ACTO|nr:5'-nucleotidase C-terminal domain-containing protein [Arcanobacterium canis]WFM83494.1 5'-nucleotidase C-terminal domain-containing protein [Arcanobacterium canis]